MTDREPDLMREVFVVERKHGSEWRAYNCSLSLTEIMRRLAACQEDATPEDFRVMTYTPPEGER